MAKQAKTATKTIRGKTYKLQHPGVMWYLQNTDRSRDQNGVLQTATYVQNLLDHVVTDPQGLKVDDFESVDELMEVVREIEDFLKS